MSDVNSKKYSLELLKSQFVLDSESPSGLSWIGKKKRKQAGTISKSSNRVAYWKARLNGAELYVHRVICTLLYGEIKQGYVVDHIDGDGLNNKVENLRVVPQKINNRNKRKQINSSDETQLVGVTKNFQPTKHSGGIYSYKATHYNMDGTTYRKYFNIDKYGEDLALLLALSWKLYWLECDKTYTKEHGSERKK